MCDFSAVLTTECVWVSFWAYLWCSNPIVNYNRGYSPLGLAPNNTNGCCCTAPPTWNLIGSKSSHSYLLNIRYSHIHCDMMSAKKDEVIGVLSLFYWVELLIVCIYFRCSLMGFDLNRHWQDPSPWAHPTLHAIKQLIVQMNQDPVSILIVKQQFLSGKNVPLKVPLAVLTECLVFQCTSEMQYYILGKIATWCTSNSNCLYILNC